MTTRGYLGIDAGTQGLSVIFTDTDLEVIACGEAGYEMVNGLPDGCYEQLAEDWELALRRAMLQLRSSLPSEHAEIEVLGIGISAQMHGEVLTDDEGTPLGPVRLWCDSRNESEGEELTRRFGVKMPKRITAARWLWTIRNQPDKAQRTAHLTTPAGWLSYRLTGQWTLGAGDAAGMFPVVQETLDYDRRLLSSFDSLVAEQQVKPLAELLPSVRLAGQDAGTLNERGAALLELPVGIPVAPAEGDQPAALAGSLIGKPGQVSVSFGTSVCANSIGDHTFDGVSASIDHFCAADGKPINMVWLRNGTTFMNTALEMFAAVTQGDRSDGIAAVMPEVLKAPADCGGLLALPFMDDEPGLGVTRGGTALFIGLNASNATPGNVVKAALLSTMLNLRLGCEELDRQGFPRTELILSGGITKTPELSQLLADVFDTPVTLLASATEGTAWGAALMAKYRHACLREQTCSWAEFLSQHTDNSRLRFSPEPSAVAQFDQMLGRYRKLMASHATLDEAVASC